MPAVEREPFNPTDSIDAMSEMFRRQVTGLAIDAYKVALYRDLSPQEQLQCFLAGALTGVVGTALASIDSQGADAMMEYLAECLPMAREMAESVVDGDGRTLKNHHDN